MKVLVADDSATSRAIALRLLGDACEVREAPGGREALEAVAGGGFDLVFLDLLMPGMDGWSVLAELATLPVAPPVVVMTADIQSTTRAKLLEMGVAGIVNKPLTREKLLAALGSARGGAGGGG